jgi:DnaJ-class molecular chaperone
MAIDFSRYKKYDTSAGHGNARQWKGAFSDRMGTGEAIEIIGKQSETVYTILEVSESATQAEIKKAFYKKITEWHPDRNPHRLEEANAMAKKIIAAYTILKK